MRNCLTAATLAAVFTTALWAQAPTNLAVKAATSKRIDLTWNGTAASYVVQRRPLGGAYASIGTVTSTTFSDTQIDPYTTYQYEVISGTSAPSNDVTTGPPPAGFTVAAPAPGPPDSDASYNYGYDLSAVLDSNGDPAFAFVYDDPNDDSDHSDTQILFRSWNRARYAWNPVVKVATVGDIATYFWNTVSLAFDSSTGTFAIASETPDNPIAIFVSADGGATWSKKATVPTDHYASAPSLALASGSLYLAYVEDKVGLKYVTGKLSADPATWLSKDAPVPAGTDIADGETTISLALDSAGNPAVAYFTPHATEYYYNILLYWRPNSGGNPIRVSDNQQIQSGGGASVKLAFFHLNPRLLVYEPRLDEEYSDAVHVIRSDDGGISWSQPVQIPPDGHSSTDYPFDLALDSQGRAAASFGRNAGSGDSVCGSPKVSRSGDLVHWTTCAVSNDDLTQDFQVYPRAIQTVFGGNDKLYLIWWEDSDNPTGNGILMYREPPASATTGPSISSVVNGATFQAGIVAGSWISILGANLSNVSRAWTGADFNGDILPTNLSGAQVKLNGLAAAVYYVSPTQLNVQAPAGISGNVTVQVTDNGVTSNTLTVTAVPNAPGLFTYPGGSKTYPAAVFANGTIVGDPSVVPGTQKAHAGDRILLYATGLTTSPAGNIIQSPIALSTTATVSVGGTPATVEFAGLVAVGEFQINIVVPNLPPGDYPLTVSVNGQTSQSGVTLPVQ